MLSTKSSLQSLGPLAIFISLVFLALSLGLAIHSWFFLSSAIRVGGAVVAMDDHAGASYPIFVFLDAQGSPHTVHSSIGSNPPDFRVSDKIKVLYQQRSPGDAVIDNPWYRWGFALASGGIGFCRLIFGLLMKRRFNA